MTVYAKLFREADSDPYRFGAKRVQEIGLVTKQHANTKKRDASPTALERFEVDHAAAGIPIF